MPQAVVAMFCGPHDEGNQSPTRRIDQAISLAVRHGFPLLVAGDAFGGAEVLRFQVRAWQAGITLVFPAFDPRHCTLADAQAVCRVILERQFDRLARIHLVTDWWHMERARVMLEHELERIVGRQILVVPESVMTGPTPDAIVHKNERQGIDDYLAGRYGQRRVIDPLRHGSQPQL